MLIPNYIGTLPPAVFCPDLAHLTPRGVLAGSTLFQEYQQSFARLCALNLCLLEPARECPNGAPAPISTTEREPTSLVGIKVPVQVTGTLIAWLQIGRLTGEARPGGEETQPASTPPDPVVKLLEIFALQLADWYVWRLTYSANHGTTGPEAISQAKEWIEVHYREPLTISVVAKKARVNPSDFCRHFHYATGTKFRTFLARTRVARSLELLTNPKRTIIDIAQAVGFRGVSQYNRNFRLLMGQSPTQFRACRLGVLPRSRAMVRFVQSKSSGALGPTH